MSKEDWSLHDLSYETMFHAGSPVSTDAVLAHFLLCNVYIVPLCYPGSSFTCVFGSTLPVRFAIGCYLWNNLYTFGINLARCTDCESRWTLSEPVLSVWHPCRNVCVFFSLSHQSHIFDPSLTPKMTFVNFRVPCYVICFILHLTSFSFNHL